MALRHPRFAAQSRNAERRGYDRKGKWDAPGHAECGEFQQQLFISRDWIRKSLFQRWKKDSEHYVRQHKDSADQYSGQKGSGPIAHELSNGVTISTAAGYAPTAA
jgi:hypothetical protein